MGGSVDLIRDVQKGGSGGPKTQVLIIDVGGPGAETLLSASNPMPVSLTSAQLSTLTPLSTVAVTGTFWQATQPVSATSLPLPAGAATAAKQPALGTAGSASSDVLSVQGVASMTPLKIDLSGTTANATAVKVDGSGVTQPASLASLPALAAGTAIIGTTIAPAQTGVVYNGTTALTPTAAFVNATASGDMTVVAATVGKKIRVLKYTIGPVSAAVNAFFKGTTLGAISSTKNFSINGGCDGSYCPQGHFLDTNAGDDLKINLSTTANVGIDVLYILI